MIRVAKVKPGQKAGRLNTVVIIENRVRTKKQKARGSYQKKLPAISRRSSVRLTKITYKKACGLILPQALKMLYQELGYCLRFHNFGSNLRFNFIGQFRVVT